MLLESSAVDSLFLPKVLRGSGQQLGSLSPALRAFDDTVQTFMQARNITSRALAVTCNGQLMLARGYTWFVDSTEIVNPTSRFRIASVTKPFTSATVMTLVQANKLRHTIIAYMKSKLGYGVIDPALHKAANPIRQWPDHDLFTQHPLAEMLTEPNSLLVYTKNFLKRIFGHRVVKRFHCLMRICWACSQTT